MTDETATSTGEAPKPAEASPRPPRSLLGTIVRVILFAALAVTSIVAGVTHLRRRQARQRDRIAAIVEERASELFAFDGLTWFDQVEALCDGDGEPVYGFRGFFGESNGQALHLAADFLAEPSDAEMRAVCRGEFPAEEARATAARAVAPAVQLIAALLELDLDLAKKRLEALPEQPPTEAPAALHDLFDESRAAFERLREARDDAARESERERLRSWLTSRNVAPEGSGG